MKLQIKQKQSELRAGQPGAPLLAHERSKWLHLQVRNTPTKEWEDAMRVDGGFLSSRGQLVPLTPVVGLVLLEPGCNFFNGVEPVDDMV